MAVVQWGEQYSVGFRELDNHHKKLFAILDRLYNQMADNASDAQINEIIKELLNYTQYHFDEEEQVMEKMQYPELFQHQRLHREFIAKIEEYQGEASVEGMAIFVAVKMADAGSQWLKEHILVVDKKYQKYSEAIVS